MDNHKTCKYCKKEFSKYDCAKLKQQDGFFHTLLNIWVFIEIPFIFIFAFLFRKSEDHKLAKRGIVYTCVNEDCIGYLDECHQRT